MIGAILQILIGGTAISVAFALLASAGVKYFARPLPYSKAFLISLEAFAVCTILAIAYYIVKAVMKLPDSVDALFTLVFISVAGTIITKLARNYGIEKTGWPNVGAKSIFVLIGLSWVLIGVVYIGNQFLG